MIRVAFSSRINSNRENTMKPHPVTGLYPVRMLISEAGLGIRTGEIQGVSKEVAERLIAAKQGEFVEPVVDKPAKSEAKA
jgi:hypothetical protein